MPPFAVTVAEVLSEPGSPRAADGAAGATVIVNGGGPKKIGMSRVPVRPAASVTVTRKVSVADCPSARFALNVVLL